jgi:hypothetical protein
MFAEPSCDYALKSICDDSDFVSLIDADKTNLFEADEPTMS